MDLERELRDALRPMLSAEPSADAIQRATQNLNPPRSVIRPWLTGAATAAVALVVVAVLAISLPRSAPPGLAVAPTDGVPGTPSGESSPDATISTSMAPPTASLESTPQPTPAVTDRALSDLERSDAFWSKLLPGETPEEVYSLDEAIDGADLIVLGRFSGSENGEVGGYPVSRFTILIDEVMKGDPQSEAQGTVRLQTLPVTEGEIEGLLPNEQTLFFLWYVPDYLERHGQPEEEQQAELYDYIALNWSQGVMRDIEGRVATLDPENPRFPAMFDGEPFEDVVDSVRNQSQTTQEPSPL